MTTRRNDSAPRGAKAPRARAPKPRKTADQKAARAARRTELKAAYVDFLRDTAGKLGIDGRSGMTKDALINAILRAEFSPSKRVKVTKTEAKREITARKKEMSKHRERGPFRTILLRADARGGLSIYGDLGPYAAARGAQVDAKTMLRRMVGPRRVDAYGKLDFGPKLIHQETVEDLAANTGGITDSLRDETGGEPVDGWIAIDKDDKGREVVLGAAFIVKFKAKDEKQAKIAFAAADTPDALRNNGRRSRANPRVSFKTADGRSVSFNARRNAGGESINKYGGVLYPEAHILVSDGGGHYSWRGTVYLSKTNAKGYVAPLPPRVGGGDRVWPLNGREVEVHVGDDLVMQFDGMKQIAGPVRANGARRNAGGGARSTSRANAGTVTVKGDFCEYLYQQGRAAAMKLVPFEPKAMHYWQDVAVYFAGHDFQANFEQILDGMASHSEAADALMWDYDYLEAAPVKCGKKKVTFADFAKAAEALRVATRKWQKANPRPDEYEY